LDISVSISTFAAVQRNVELTGEFHILYLIDIE
jgi:hypothetical protein